VHFDEAIATVGKAAIVCGHQQRDTFIGGNVEKELKYGRAGVFVERAGGFVGQQDFGVVHERTADGRTLTFATGELLNLLIQAVGESGALGKKMQSLVGEDAIGSRSYGRDQAILSERQVGDEVVKLEDETDFVTKQLEQVAMAIHFDAVDNDVAAVGCVESAEEMEESAFAAAGGTAECDGFSLSGFEVYAAKHGDGSVVVGLPHAFCAKNDLAAIRICGEGAHSNRSASTARMRMA
jgi:hypothetical protein